MTPQIRKQLHSLLSLSPQIRKQFETAPGTHQPDVFTLPRDHEVHQQPMLEPCEDLEFLLRKFQRDVCAVMGVPDDIMGIQQKGGIESARKTMATGKVFTTNMQDLCRQLASLLRSVYKRIYKKDNVEFTLIPMPRLEIENIADLKVLSEIGAINPDMSLQISQIVLGEDIDNKRRRLELQQGQQRGQFVLGQGEVQALKGQKPDAATKGQKPDAAAAKRPLGEAGAQDAAAARKRPAPPGGAKNPGATR